MDAHKTGEQIGTPLRTKVFFAVAILGLAAAGVGALNVYSDQSRAGRELQERGVEADADVMSVSGPEIETHTELRVSYDPAGPQILEFAEVQDCAGARYEPGIETVRVVYLPDDPEVIRLQLCRSTFDSDVFPGIVGVAFLATVLFMLWRLRRLWGS